MHGGQRRSDRKRCEKYQVVAAIGGWYRKARARIARLNLDRNNKHAHYRAFHSCKIAFVLALVCALFSFSAPSRAEPLITQGIGIQNCGKLAADLKPSQGLDHPPNYLLFYWVQGYVSAANFLLLNEYHNFVDMKGVDVNTIIKLVFDFCTAKPNDKPVSAIDKFIRDAKKVDVKEKDVFNPWEQ
jgi:hypothetical protein